MSGNLKCGAAVICIVAALIMLPGPALAESRLLAGHTGEEWFAGVQLESISRRLLGFVGYQEDVVSGALAVTSKPGLIGYVQAGRQVFVGNVKYAVTAYGGDPDFLSSRSGENRLGVTAEYKQLLGNEAAGIEGEVNLFGGPRLMLKPFVEFHGNGVVKTQLEFGTEGIALGLTYQFKPAAQLNAAVFASYDFLRGSTDYGAAISLAESLYLTGAVHSTTGMRLGVTWEPPGYPLTAGINWQKDQVQWYVSCGL